MTTNPVIVPAIIPEDAAPLAEDSQVEDTGVLIHGESLEALNKKNVFVNFKDGSFAVGRVEIKNLNRGIFTIGTDGKSYDFANVSNFREV